MLQAKRDKILRIAVRTASRNKPDRCPKLAIKNMIKAVLGRCPWGMDDYRLQVENLGATRTGG